MSKMKTGYSAVGFLWLLLAGCQQGEIASSEDLAAQVIGAKYLKTITIDGKKYKPTDQNIFTTFSVARSGSSRTEIIVKGSYQLISTTGIVTDSFEQTAPLRKQSSAISFINAIGTSTIEGIYSRGQSVMEYTKIQNGVNTTITLVATQ